MQTSSALQEKYDTQYEQDLQAWRLLGGESKARNIQKISKHLNINTVLDVGSGDGSVLYWLDKNGFCPSIKSLEISQSGIEQIKAKNLSVVQEIKLFDGYTIPYEDNSFDLVTCSHVLEHVEFPRRLLREIKRVSKYQVLEIPIDFSQDVDKKVEHFLSYGHINIYTPQTFRFLLQSEGLEVLASKNLMYDPAVYEYMYRSKPSFQVFKLRIKDRIRRNSQFLVDRRPDVTVVLCQKTESGLEIMR